MMRVMALLFALTTLATAQGQVYKSGDGVSLPTVVSKINPAYTKAAKDERIQGNVALKVVVLQNGDVGEVTVTRSLDEKYGLDRQAVEAMKGWKFTPGTKDGKPVSVEIAVEMTFTLK